jgi:NAD(P)-dependent dehydrogenase (short-subunit alcohol dehydrogenase family)
MPRLQDKVAIVTGGSQGIGADTVRQFLQEGATVHSADLAPTQVPEHDRLHHHVVDVTDEDRVQDFVNDVLAADGRIDVLFSNAGIHLSRAFLDTSLEEYERVMDVNVRGGFLVIREVLRAMVEAGAGSIVVNSSNGGLIGRPNDSVYNASKHALVGLTRSLTVAYAHTGVRFNTVNPGPIDTDFLRALDPELSLEGEKRMAASVPAARIGTAAEVAAAVVFLASDESTYVNGVSIAVDGGKAAGTMGWERYSMDFKLPERHWAQGQGS